MNSTHSYSKKSADLETSPLSLYWAHVAMANNLERATSMNHLWLPPARPRTFMEETETTIDAVSTTPYLIGFLLWRIRRSWRTWRNKGLGERLGHLDVLLVLRLWLPGYCSRRCDSVCCFQDIFKLESIDVDVVFFVFATRGAHCSTRGDNVRVLFFFFLCCAWVVDSPHTQVLRL